MELPFDVNNNEPIVVTKKHYSDVLIFILFFGNKHECSLQVKEKPNEYFFHIKISKIIVILIIKSKLYFLHVLSINK